AGAASGESFGSGGGEVGGELGFGWRLVFKDVGSLSVKPLLGGIDALEVVSLRGGVDIAARRIWGFLLHLATILPRGLSRKGTLLKTTSG
ncbi:MAG: hypothetical protein WBX03_06615, partial [Terriglobales bacterium]